MSEVGLDLYLAADLFLHFTRLQLGFVEYLESTNETCCALTSEVHTAKFAFSQRLPDLEHAEMESFGGGLIKERRIGGSLRAGGALIGRPSHL